MKLNKFLSLATMALIAFASTTVMSCGGGDDPTPMPPVVITPSGNGGNTNTPSTSTTINLNTGYTYTIPNGQGMMWTSNNPSIAKVEDNVITANKVGQAIISTQANGGQSIIVNVNPAYNYYAEPFVKWGATKSQVKSAVSLQIFDETSTSIIYNGTGSVQYYEYSFTNGVLQYVMLTTTLSFAQIQDFLWERYIPGKTDENIKYLYSLDNKTVILWDMSSSAILYGLNGNSYISPSEMKSIVARMPSNKQ